MPVERIQITENSLGNPYPEGLTNFCEYFVEFKHDGEIENYRRALSLNDAISTVDYTIGGVRFQREYFTSYPDRVGGAASDSRQGGRA